MPNAALDSGFRQKTACRGAVELHPCSGSTPGHHSGTGFCRSNLPPSWLDHQRTGLSRSRTLLHALPHFSNFSAQSPALAVPTSPFPPCYLHVVASGRHGLTELKANFTLPILHCHPYHLCPLARTWHATPLGLLSQSGKPSSLDLSLLPLLTFNPSADLVALSQIYTVSSSVPKPKPEPPTRHGGPQQGSPHPHVLPTLAHILSGTAIRSVTPLLETVDTPHLARDKSRCPEHNLQGLAQTHPLPLACHAPATLALLLLTHFCH